MLKIVKESKNWTKLRLVDCSDELVRKVYIREMEGSEAILSKCSLSAVRLWFSCVHSDCLGSVCAAVKRSYTSHSQIETRRPREGYEPSTIVFDLTTT